ncbi:MAG TPA: hypothetical protein VK395_22690 [Gemmataceae bacterium]|nr:hypothetical protein [Gemmataceae bacterium]
MIKYITADTLANTVRMAARSRRPKAVFLASEMADIELVQALLSKNECRVIPAHSRQNAVEAFELLVKSGYQGVFTAVNTQFAPANEGDVLAGGANEPDEIVGIEGLWEDLKKQESMLSGQHVRVTFVSNPESPTNRASSKNGERPPNTEMLQVLQELEEIRKAMNPKKDKKDYLREAREGAMYGFGDD